VEEHLSSGQIERFRSRLAPQHETSVVLRHLAVCKGCRERLYDDPHYQALRRFLWEPDRTEPNHLSDETVEAYLADRLTREERDLADRHIKSCDECRDETIEMRMLLPVVMENAFGRGGVRPLPAPSKVHTPRWRGYGIILARAAPWAAIFLLCAGVLVLRREVADLRGTVSGLSKVQSPEPSASPSANSSGYIDEPNAGEPNSGEPAAGEPDSQGVSAGAAIALKDGEGMVTLDNQGVLAGLAGLPPSYENMIKEALVRQRLAISPSLKELGGKPDTLMSAGKAGAFSLLSPMAMVVKSLKPTFHWLPLAGATGYTVTISDSDRSQVASSSTLTDTTWTVPASLKRGQIYYWQVAAIKDGHEIISPSPWEQRAKFKILGPKTWAELIKAESTYQGSHLVLGALYAQAGLLDDARREIRALERANPNSAVARALLRSIHPTSSSRSSSSTP